MVLFRGIAIYIAIAGVILALVLMSIITRPDPAPNPVALPAVNPYENTLAASGIIEAVDKNITIGVPQSGLVKELFVNVREHVQVGQPLFVMDDRELQAQLVVQQANVSVAEANLERLKDQLSRLESVKDARAISQDELKTRQNDVRVSEAQLKAAQAQVEQTERLIDRLIVRAPRDGVILQNNIRPGEYTNAASSNTAMLLGNLDRLQVRADIDEQNAGRVSPEDSAVAYPKNNTQLAIPLRFDYIEPYVVPKRSLTGSSDERVDTRVLQVIYTFEQPKDYPVYVGQQVDVFIEVPALKTESKEPEHQMKKEG